MNADKRKVAQQLKTKLSGLRPLNQGEVTRLREEFSIYNCYDSNAIEGSTLTLRETAMILQEGITIAEKTIKEHLEAIGHKDRCRTTPAAVSSSVSPLYGILACGV